MRRLTVLLEVGEALKKLKVMFPLNGSIYSEDIICNDIYIYIYFQYIYIDMCTDSDVNLYNLLHIHCIYVYTQCALQVINNVVSIQYIYLYTKIGTPKICGQ